MVAKRTKTDPAVNNFALYRVDVDFTVGQLMSRDYSDGTQYRPNGGVEDGSADRCQRGRPHAHDSDQGGRQALYR